MDMVTGIVKDNWNESLPGKIQVEYRLGEAGICLSGWIPVMTGYAGPGYGAYLLPETGSEVVVSFLHGNPDCPFVMGCLWGAVNTLPEGAALEENNRKQLKTKAGWQILVDEEEGTLCVTDDKSESSIMLSSKEGTLTLDIKTKLELKMEGEPFLTIEKGTLTAALDWEVKAKKLTVTAEDGMELGGQTVAIAPEGEVTVKGKEVELAPSQNVTIKGQKTEIKPSQEVLVAGGKISLKPSQSLELKAMQTKIEGTSLEIKGTASAKVEAGGILELKGTMVKVN